MTVLCRAAALAAFALAPLAARADAVSDAIAAAQAAYEAGDLNGTSAQLITATKALAEMQGGLLLSHFPAAPDGWTRTDNTDMAANLGMIGGGSGGEARYDAPDGSGVTLTAFADNMMVSSMAGMLGNPAMMAMMGKTEVIGGVTFLNQEGSFSALLDNRVLVQAQGGSEEQNRTILGLIDFAAMAAFDKK